jgi:UDP-glucose 4-epimerase
VDPRIGPPWCEERQRAGGDNPTTVVVTGGAGFLGARLAERLVRFGHDVVVLDDLSGRSGGEGRRSVPGRGPIQLVVGDAGDQPTVRRIFRRHRPEVIFHLAARSFVPACEDDPEGTWRVNVGATEVVAREALRVRPGFLVFTSSGAVYRPSSDPHKEDDALGADSVYGQSKLAAEQSLRELVRSSSTRLVTVRPFNLYGPHDTNPHVLSELIRSLHLGSIAALGNLESCRDYLYIDDAARALASLPSATIDAGETIVNLGTGVATSVRALVRLVARVLCMRVELVQDPSRFRAVDRPVLCCDPARAARLFPGFPWTSLPDGLTKTLVVEGLAAYGSGPSGSPPVAGGPQNDGFRSGAAEATSRYKSITR